MATKKSGTHQDAETGFAIRGLNDGYYECNGIGDTSLAGTPLTCEIFQTQNEAQEAIDNNDDLDGEDCEIVGIARVAAAIVTED